MNFEQQYLGVIIETYEKELMKSDSPKAFKVLSIKNVRDLKSVTKFSRKTVSSFSGSKYNFDENPDSANSKKEFNSEKLLENLKHVNITIDSKVFNEYIERCFGCEFRLSWDWQFLPPDGIINPLDELANEILKALQFLENVLNGGEKRLKQLCHLPLLFDGIPCPQDILALILALKILLSKYKSVSLQLKVDWMALFGPIVIALVSLLSYLVNMLFDALAAPLSCSIATMGTGLQYARLINSELFSTPKQKPEEDIPYSSSAYQQVTGSSPFGENYDNVNETNFQSVDEESGLGISETTEVRQSYVAIPAPVELAVPSGTTVGFTIDSFVNKPEKPSWLDLSLLEQFFAISVEAKDYLNHYKIKIQRLLDALIGLVKGKKLLDIQNMSIIILIAELISLLIAILETDLSTLCNSKDKSKLEKFLRTYLSSTDDSVEVSVEENEAGETIAKLSNGNDVKILSCSTANTTEDLNAIKNILEEIERLTKNG